MILKKDVFMAWEHFPIDFEEAVRKAKLKNFKYLDFNGKVFIIDNIKDINEINYEDAICTREDLINKIWFTSDTHFGSERTLELSKRPFILPEVMDDVLKTNWNNVIKEDDLVFHLGDFGNYNKVKELNGKIILLYGNYERNDKDITEEKLLELGFAKIYTEPANLILDEFKVRIMHEPSNYTLYDGFNLFGHIHKLQMVKKFGLNVGTDCHSFTPIDLETIKFYKNAIENHYDEEVFM